MAKPKTKILVVDDENTAKHLIRHHLFTLGFSDVIEANDGDDALQILDKEKVDLIIADWNMPKKDGIVFFKCLQENPSLKGIPFLMTSVEGEKEKIKQAIQAGVRHYIVKPVYAETLGKKINQMLNRNQ